MQSDSSAHLSVKEDDDPILEYQNMETENIVSVNIGGYRFYKASLPQMVSMSLKYIDKLQTTDAMDNYSLFLDPYRFMWTKRRKKYAPIMKNSFLNIPSGAGMVWMSQMAGKDLPEIIPSVAYIMNMVRVAQAKKYNVFIVGGKDENLDKLSFNLRRSFPRLQIVGRHHGYVKGPGMERVVMALQKTQPHLILLGLGWKKEADFLLQYRDRFPHSYIIPLGGILDILSGKRKKAPDFITNKNLIWLYRIFNRPYRWHRIFNLVYWLGLCTVARFFPHKNYL